MACTRRGEAREATNTVPYLAIRVRVPVARPNSVSFYVISPDIAHPLFSFFLPSCQPPRLVVGQSTSDQARMEKARRFSVGEEPEERAQGVADRAESRKPTLRCFISRDLLACHGDRRGSANDRRIVRLMTSPLKNAPLRIRYANRVIGFSVYVGRASIVARNRARFTADPIVAIIFFILFDFSVVRDVVRCRDGYLVLNKPQSRGMTQNVENDRRWGKVRGDQRYRTKRYAS